ncbi:sensor domain-containing diguanylate cyclase [Alishewanella sp. HL-SH06]|uniref:sensor domain-containing diguanylate cyclase n=1 Tax=Alishewanella sp. HL-SH06 TaxID=3461144 RepID=UPI004042B4FE
MAEVLTAAEKSSIKLTPGLNQFTLRCDLNQPGVFSFQRHGLNRFSWQQAGITQSPIRSGEVTFQIDQGEFSALLSIDSKFAHNPRFQWQPLTDFMLSSQKHNLIMGLFYGLSFTLMLYVLIISRKVPDKALKLYSAYIFCITSFILLQEGQLFLYIASHLLREIHLAYLLSIGLTVVSATWFMCEILKVNTDFPRTSLIFKTMSLIVLFSCLLRMVIENHPSATAAAMLMSYGTLALVAAIFASALWQWQRRVSEAGLVFCALSIVLISMIFRIVLLDSNIFVQRYGFIIAFAVESLMLAIAVSRRIGRIAMAKERAENEANIDMLCNILNRRGFSLKAQHLMDYQRQNGDLLGIFYIDVDSFKQLNDTYGHHVGDTALKEIARYLQSQMRMEDAVARIGGDEFVALACFRSQHEIVAKLDELQKHFEQFTISLHQQHFSVSASIGYAMFSTVPETLEALLAAGDAAMYQAKSQRKALVLANTR